MDKLDLLEEVCMQIRLDVERWEIDEVLKLLEHIPEDKLREYEKLRGTRSYKHRCPVAYERETDWRHDMRNIRRGE